VVLATADAGLRQRLTRSLMALRWSVRGASGGAEALAQIEEIHPEALLMDAWLPDLEASEFVKHLRLAYPALDILRLDGSLDSGGARSPRRNELLHALREAMDEGPGKTESGPHAVAVQPPPLPLFASIAQSLQTPQGASLPEMIGESACMRELASLIRLVAPRSATVLIEGETGTGKEIVARAVHRLSTRSLKPFAVLNCAAIPEALLEAELFGHTRGAFTGAVQSRTGRIEAANGGTLFLDEIGEMPIGLQAKMLRFLECGELQRVGDNETLRVDVRVVAATHQPLEQKATEGLFRLDLYHRLAVFPVEVPPLRARLEDLNLLVEFFLERMGREMPRKGISPAATDKLREYSWPGNVRELMHVLERAAILVGERPTIGPDEIYLRRSAQR
jgi:DNA-binding NtrC family response regulator